jgi:hypothetical protein
MTVRDNPMKRIMVVRKIGGKLAVDVQGTVRVPIKLRLRGTDGSLFSTRRFSSCMPLSTC